MTISENQGATKDQAFERFAFDLLDELLDDDWTVREMFEYFGKWREPHSFEEIQKMFDWFQKEEMVTIRDSGLITNRNGGKEMWNWYKMTQRGHEYYSRLLVKFSPNLKIKNRVEK